MHRRFCPDCGTQLFSEAESRPHLIFVRNGALDDTGAADARRHDLDRLGPGVGLDRRVTAAVQRPAAAGGLSIRRVRALAALIELLAWEQECVPTYLPPRVGP